MMHSLNRKEAVFQNRPNHNKYKNQWKEIEKTNGEELALQINEVKKKTIWINRRIKDTRQGNKHQWARIKESVQNKKRRVDCERNEKWMLLGTFSPRWIITWISVLDFLKTRFYLSATRL